MLESYGGVKTYVNMLLKSQLNYRKNLKAFNMNWTEMQIVEGTAG